MVVPNIFIGLIDALSSGIQGAANKITSSELTGSGVLNVPLNEFITTQHESNGSVPKAFLNWIVMDEEQFKLVEGNYGAVSIPSVTGSMNKQLMQANNGNDIEIKKNGYLYIYVSNESKGSVYFDDIRVEHTKGALLEETHYYPFGLTMAGVSSKAAGSLVNRKKFNGKEEQRQEFADGSGLEWLDYGARMYDNQIGRWNIIDPKSQKFADLSPYDFVGGNPISRIDLNGMDWFRDEKNKMQYDPNVHGQKDLKDKQSYVGVTYQEKNKKGAVTSDYRKDGSIMFSKQKDAYNRMYDNSKSHGNREEFGVIMKNGVLVMPDYKSKSDATKPEDYNYSWKNGNLVDAVNGETKKIVGTIHTHLGPGDPDPSGDDQKYFSKNTPNKPYLTMGYNGNLYGDYGTWKPQADGYHVQDVNSTNMQIGHYNVNNASILNGYLLSEFLQAYMNKVLQ